MYWGKGHWKIAPEQSTSCFLIPRNTTLTAIQICLTYTHCQESRLVQLANTCSRSFVSCVGLLCLVSLFVCWVCLFVCFFKEKQVKVLFSHENYNPEEKYNWRKNVHHCGGTFSVGKYICPRHKLTTTPRFNSKSVKMIPHLSFIEILTQYNNNV